MIIDCDGCRVRGPACQDCVVTVLLGAHDAEQGHRHGSAGGPSQPVLVCGPLLPVRGTRVDLDHAERTAIDVLARSGLVPPLRVVPAAPQEPRPSPEPDTSTRRGLPRVDSQSHTG